EAKPCRILILGDGNFSFSLALARGPPRQQGRRKRTRNRPYEVVATSFDGPLDLLRKYPESSKILAGLRSLGATVLHNVDATSLDTRVTGAVAAASC
ncbi:unnamed protein product, partial [Scytosiphon promiscuus]